MNVRDTLIVKAAALARSSPYQWSEFIAALKTKTDALKDDCVNAPQSNIVFVAQGRAQYGNELLALLEGAVTSADRILSSGGKK